MLYESIALPAELRWRRRRVIPTGVGGRWAISEEGAVKQTAPNGVKAMKRVLSSAADVAEIVCLNDFLAGGSHTLNR